MSSERKFEVGEDVVVLAVLDAIEGGHR